MLFAQCGTSLLAIGNFQDLKAPEFPRGLSQVAEDRFRSANQNLKLSHD
jgi:hypothetical protein